MASPKHGFRCKGPGCGKWIGDRRYVGPAGHAPQNLCYECWMLHWEWIEACAANGGLWTRIDEALWLFCHGLSLREVSVAVAVPYTTLRRWVKRLRQRPNLVPEWVVRLQQDYRDRLNNQRRQEVLG